MFLLDTGLTFGAFPRLPPRFLLNTIPSLHHSHDVGSFFNKRGRSKLNYPAIFRLMVWMLKILNLLCLLHLFFGSSSPFFLHNCHAATQHFFVFIRRWSNLWLDLLLLHAHVQIEIKYSLLKNWIVDAFAARYYEFRHFCHVWYVAEVDCGQKLRVITHLVPDARQFSNQNMIH